MYGQVRNSQVSFQFGLVCFISLFEKKDEENTDGQGKHWKNLAEKKRQGKGQRGKDRRGEILGKKTFWEKV